MKGLACRPRSTRSTRQLRSRSARTVCRYQEDPRFAGCSRSRCGGRSFVPRSSTRAGSSCATRWRERAVLRASAQFRSALPTECRRRPTRVARANPDRAAAADRTPDASTRRDMEPVPRALRSTARSLSQSSSTETVPTVGIPSPGCRAQTSRSAGRARTHAIRRRRLQRASPMRCRYR